MPQSIRNPRQPLFRRAAPVTPDAPAAPPADANGAATKPGGARPAALISTGLIVIVALAAVLGFNTLAGRLSQPGARNGGGGQGGQTLPDQGVILGGAPAPSFTLTDQNGAPVSLASLAWKPTVLTFFDSLCPHTDCSLMAQYINTTAQDAGATSSKVNWVAISLNPWHDTPQTAATFLKAQKMGPPLRYLLGSQDQLQPVWDGFHMQSILQPDGIVIHTTGVYLLDSQTHEQIYMDEGFNPATLAKDITLLVNNGPAAFKGQATTKTTGGVTLTHGVGAMQVTLSATPGSYGSYDFAVLIQDGDGNAVSNADVTLDLTMTSMAMSPVHVALTPIQPASAGGYEAKGVLSMTGQWIATVTITTPGSATPLQSTFTFNATY